MKLRNMMIYQVFVRDHSPEGTFSGVMKDLDRIKDLGVDIVYFLPIHPVGEKNRKGSLGSPYAIRDYRAVNPEYGTLDDFRSLVDAIHDRGMKCVMDVVYNHTSPDSVLSAEHPEWFYRRADGSFGNRVGDWTDVIDLDYGHKSLWDYQIETLKYWAETVDGFRCDVAPMVPIEFWERAVKEVAEVRRDCIWIAESVEPDFILQLRSQGIPVLSDSELYRAFDVCYDYDIYYDLVDYLSHKCTLQTYLDAVNRQEWIYPHDYVKMRFLENHDKTRTAHFVYEGMETAGMEPVGSREERILRNITAFSFFQKGIAFVYAGQEYGATHLPSLFDRDTISLKPERGVDLCALIRRLSEIKKDSVFTESSYHAKETAQDVCAAVHSSGDRKAVGVFSMKGERAESEVPLPNGTYRDEISGKDLRVSDGILSTEGEPVIIIA